MNENLNSISKFLKEKNYASAWLSIDTFDNELFSSISSVVTVPKGQMLFHQGHYNNSIYIVRSGRLRLFFIDSDGNENCIYIAEKGCMIGEVSALDEQPNYASAYSITDTTLYKLSKIDFKRILNTYPMISIEIIKNISQKVRLLTSEIEYFSKSSVSRVAISLISLCKEYGISTNKGIKISIRFTHEELANLTSLNRVTVTKTYKKLINNKIIYNESGHIIVLKLKELMDLVE